MVRKIKWVQVFILIVLSLFLSKPTYAIDRNECIKRCPSSPINATDPKVAGKCETAQGETTIKLSKSGNNGIKVEIATATPYGNYLCAVLNPNYTNGTADDCRLISQTTDSNSAVVFDITTAKLHQVVIAPSGDISGQIVCAASSIDLSTDLIGLATPTVTQAPSSSCMNVEDVPCRILNSQSAVPTIEPRAPCSGFYCGYRPGLESNGTVIIHGSPSPTPVGIDTDEFKTQLDVASGGCGNEGNICCEPDKVKSNSSSSFLPDWIVGIWSFTRSLYNMMTGGEQYAALTQSVASGTDGRPCLGDLTSSIEQNDGTVIEGKAQRIIDYQGAAGNTGYLIDVKSDIKTTQGCDAMSDPTSREICKNNVGNLTSKQFVQDDKIKLCTCIDDSKEAVAPPVGFKSEVSEEELYKQICTNSTECIKCLKDRQRYWQTFVGLDKCFDRSTAVQNLVKKMNPATTTSSNAAATTKIESALRSCQDSTVWQGGQRLCEACILGSGYWTVYGCSPLQIAGMKDKFTLCNGLSEKERPACLSCLWSDRMWTAIGCVDMKVDSFIQNQIFGWGLGLAGTCALLCIIYSAISMQLSAGNPDHIKHAQDMITSCITGLIIIVMSVYILNIIGVDILRIPWLTR